jgi:hypothetical protein
MAARYPHLGFDPAPGDLGELETLIARLDAIGGPLSAAPQSLVTSADAGLWQGRTADAFSETAGDLYRALTAAGTMCANLKSALQTWHDKLVDFQLRAHQLDRAAEAWHDHLTTLGEDAPKPDVEAAKAALAQAHSQAHTLSHEHHEAAHHVASRLQGS